MRWWWRRLRAWWRVKRCRHPREHLAALDGQALIIHTHGDYYELRWVCPDCRRYTIMHVTEPEREQLR